MNKQPLVSVIMNCYNSDTYLKEAIESVYSQTYSNWEIVFWDNDSSDHSADIAKSFNEKLKYFKADKTVPLYQARNLALEKCSGEIIAFLDCDDIWLPSKLSLQVEQYNLGSDFIYTSFNIINSHGVEVKAYVNYKSNDIVTKDIIRRNPISISSVLISKKLLEENRFDSRYTLLGDIDLWIRLSLLTNLKVINKVLQQSRQHENNTSKLRKELWLIERRLFYKDLLKNLNFKLYWWIVIYILKTEIKGFLNKW